MEQDPGARMRSGHAVLRGGKAPRGRHGVAAAVPGRGLDKVFIPTGVKNHDIKQETISPPLTLEEILMVFFVESCT